jgi:hypothetical protein
VCVCVNRKFGQIVVWFECEVIEWSKTWIGSRNCSRNVSSSQTQYCSSWSCCTKHFTHWSWKTQNLCILIDSAFLSFFFSSSHKLIESLYLWVIVCWIVEFNSFSLFCFVVCILFIVLKWNEMNIGFWNVTNSWENRSWKGNNTTQHYNIHNTSITQSHLSFSQHWLWIETRLWWIPSLEFNNDNVNWLIDWIRQTQQWDQCVGWHLNHFHTEYTVRNPMCGHLQLSVSVFVCVFVFVLNCWLFWELKERERENESLLFKHTHTHAYIDCILLFVLIDMIIIVVSVWDRFTKWTPQRQRYSWCWSANQVSSLCAVSFWEK